ncbi:type II toxin-antitoxin system RelE/ParE family toxin [Iningainema tapete]|uniref:Type II toxin-antitoxin system RelE/ParE family toxin n=1 Tax=Iningainema tapete BLCC-T55 TaxID=2748662 RepID=A0A8J7C8C0_9CYAN|nr:type II toxin-antitoxin system RelE/ParE family toxin [Iningainema tapete]MBD2774421.1 type II toxin-antitoxin system RelE/ParE family toxin [Iningainema tapete BLCC-T55]
MSQYIISLPASRDLRAIADYFAVENVEAGEHLLQEFNQKCKQLASFPKMGRQYEALRSGLRGVPLDGYIIFYQIIDDGIEIVRVVSGRRNLKSLFGSVE